MRVKKYYKLYLLCISQKKKKLYEIKTDGEVKSDSLFCVPPYCCDVLMWGIGLFLMMTVNPKDSYVQQANKTRFTN